jgi:hypothetical protein
MSKSPIILSFQVICIDDENQVIVSSLGAEAMDLLHAATTSILTAIDVNYGFTFTGRCVKHNVDSIDFHLDVEKVRREKMILKEPVHQHLQEAVTMFNRNIIEFDYDKKKFVESDGRRFRLNYIRLFVLTC